MKPILEETIEEKLKSSEEVNVILGLAGEIHGNIVLGATKNTVIKKPIKLKDINDNFEFQHNLIIVDENSNDNIGMY